MYKQTRGQLGRIQAARAVAPCSDSPSCIEQIRCWLAECDNHHDCKPSASTWMPTRIINVNPTPNGLQPFVMESLDFGGATDQYAALTYRWGKVLLLRLKKAKLGTFRSCIPWKKKKKKFPNILQDAPDHRIQLGLALDMGRHVSHHTRRRNGLRGRGCQDGRRLRERLYHHCGHDFARLPIWASFMSARVASTKHIRVRPLVPGGGYR